MPRSLESFRRLRWGLIAVKRLYYRYIWGMDIHPSARFSLSARFDLVNPRGVHLGAECYVAFGATIMSHDITRNLYAHTRIGRRCFIGAGSIILPGVTIGDGAIVGVGSIVTKDVPARSIVAGNPSRIIREGIDVGPYGLIQTPAKSPPAPE